MRLLETQLIPVEVFYSFAEIDTPLLKQLEHHLSLLRRRGMIAPWHRRQILPGQNWQGEVDTHLRRSSLILLLISPDFLASDYCYEAEMQLALQRHAMGQAHVVPILLRPVSWQDAPFVHLKVLPSTGKAITTWSNQDEAWVDVAEGIRPVLEELFKRRRQEGEASGRTRRSRPVPFPPIWNVPYRYSFSFTGREQVVQQLFETFASDVSSLSIPTQALNGLGGLGKTQTAVQYAYRYRQEYQAVLWADAESEAALLASFKTVAKLLGFSDTDVQSEQSLVASIHEWMRKHDEWLLILDNADDLTRIAPFLPQAASGHLLLTTRATALGPLAQSVALMPLEPDEGAICLLRRAGYITGSASLNEASAASVKAARELSLLMGGLPLALEQAGAYIEATGRSMTSYLELYKEFHGELHLEQFGPVQTYRSAVAFAWNLAREAVQDENPAALELLHFCAFLAPHGIPHELFIHTASLLGPQLGPVAADSLAFDRAIALLFRHSLLKKEVDRETDIPRLMIHTVLQEVLRDSMDPRIRRSIAGKAVQLITHASSQILDPIMQVHLQHAEELFHTLE